MQKNVFLWILPLAGLVLFAADSASAVSYSYDNQMRLTGAQYGDGKSLSFSYDTTGNRLSAAVAVSNQASAGPTTEAQPAPDTARANGNQQQGTAPAAD